MSEPLSRQAEWTRVIGANIQEARKSQNVSAQMLSDRCTALGFPIPRSTLANLESGRKQSVPVHEVAVVATALGVPFLDLIRAEGFDLPDEQPVEAPAVPPQSDIGPTVQLVLHYENPIEAFVAVRRIKRLSVKDVAAKLGWTVKQVKQIESEMDPHMSTMRRYALAVGVVYQHRVVVGDSRSTS